MKTHLKAIALFLSVLIIFQGCTVYKSASVTLEEASKSNTKVRVKTFNNKTLKFDRIEVANNKIYGIKINNGERSIALIEEDNIEKMQLKDKTASNILGITITVAVTVVMFVTIIDKSLNNLGSNNSAN